MSLPHENSSASSVTAPNVLPKLTIELQNIASAVVTPLFEKMQNDMQTKLNEQEQRVTEVLNAVERAFIAKKKPGKQ